MKIERDNMSGTSEPQLRFRALAGFLAEQSVQTLVLTYRGARREVHARSTDLPRELEAIARDGGEIEVPQFRAMIQFVGTDVRCVCPDPSISIAILKALATN